MVTKHSSVSPWRRAQKATKIHLRRIFVEVVNFLFNHDWLFWLIGLLNGRFGFLESIFLVYPANEEYGLAYAYPFRLRKNRWFPSFAGILRQGDKWGVMFGVSSSNGQFEDPENLDNLRMMAERMEELRQLLGAKRKTFAGILPGVLHSRGIVKETPEADMAAEIVAGMVDSAKVRLQDLHPVVIILGHKGFIGRRVTEILKKKGEMVVGIDLGDKWPEWAGWSGDEKVVVLNITRNNALADYVDCFCPGWVIINEVYPPPSDDLVKRIKGRGCDIFHIVGVEADAWPKFPSVYEGGIPCCAAWPSAGRQVCIKKM